MTYTREAVEDLMPAVFDPDFLFSSAGEGVPDPDMPKSWKNKSQGNTIYAAIADIKSAWAWAKAGGLTLKEQRAVFMRHVLDQTEKQIGQHEACSRQAISARLATAVGKLVAHLNGRDYNEDYESELAT